MTVRPRGDSQPLVQFARSLSPEFSEPFLDESPSSESHCRKTARVIAKLFVVAPFAIGIKAGAVAFATGFFSGVGPQWEFVPLDEAFDPEICLGAAKWNSPTVFAFVASWSSFRFFSPNANIFKHEESTWKFFCEMISP
jgi:hypothetical protein